MNVRFLLLCTSKENWDTGNLEQLPDQFSVDDLFERLLLIEKNEWTQ